jgi:hypothetical protein
MLGRLCVVALVLMLLEGQAWAKPIPDSEKKVGLWSIVAFDDNSGKYAGCGAVTQYQDVSMHVGIGASGRWEIGWQNRTWNFKVGERLNASLFVDSSGPYPITLVVDSPTAYSAKLPMDFPIAADLRKGQNVFVMIGQRRVGYTLHGSSAALDELESCHRRYAGGAAAKPATAAAPALPATTAAPAPPATAAAPAPSATPAAPAPSATPAAPASSATAAAPAPSATAAAPAPPATPATPAPSSTIGGTPSAGLASGLSAAGAQGVEWVKTIDVPIGENMPPDVKAEVLGIQLGASIDAMRPILKKLAAEDQTDPKNHAQCYTKECINRLIQGDKSLVTDPNPTYKEVTSTLTLDGTSPPITATQVTRIDVWRVFGPRQDLADSEKLQVTFSAPSSGAQVLQIYRENQYPRQSQPRISETIKAVSERFKHNAPLRKGNRIVFLFSKGSASGASQGYGASECYGADLTTFTPATIGAINPSRGCDVMLELEFFPGISADHAATIRSRLVDNQRARLDYKADYDFLMGYANRLAKKSAAPPKF